MARRKPNGKGDLPPPRATDWVSRALARAGVLTVEEAEAAVREGRLHLKGRRVRTPLAEVRPGDTLTLDGQPVVLDAPTRVLAFHKPAGCVTSREAERDGRPTVFSLLLAALPPGLRQFNWHAVGRLDADTTGLLLFTNDERFVQHATSPTTHLPKRYLARVSPKATLAQLQPLLRPLELGKGEASLGAARVQLRAPGLVELTLTEGKFHQVKRMLGAVGLPVLALHREAVGELTLLDLPEGAFRELSADEISGALRFSAR